jgi:hypothetical protein
VRVKVKREREGEKERRERRKEKRESDLDLLFIHSPMLLLASPLQMELIYYSSRSFTKPQRGA